MKSLCIYLRFALQTFSVLLYFLFYYCRQGVEDPVEESSSQPKLVDGDLSLKEEEEDENPNGTATCTNQLA